MIGLSLDSVKNGVQSKVFLRRPVHRNSVVELGNCQTWLFFLGSNVRHVQDVHSGIDGLFLVLQMSDFLGWVGDFCTATLVLFTATASVGRSQFSLGFSDIDLKTFSTLP